LGFGLKKEEKLCKDVSGTAIDLWVRSEDWDAKDCFVVHVDYKNFVEAVFINLITRVMDLIMFNILNRKEAIRKLK
jgi:hypothetical protein